MVLGSSDSSSWHSKQSFSREVLRSLGTSEAWISWQESQEPCRTAVWTDFDWSSRLWQP